MAKYTLLTPQAADAVHWVMSRLPEAGFAEFQREMEIVMARTLGRYGVTSDVITGFSITQFIADREPLESAVFGTQYDQYGNTFLVPDDQTLPVYKLHEDALWYPAAAHHTRASIERVGGGKSPARATKFGDPAKGEKTPRSYFIEGTRYACDAGQFVECGGNWYSLLTDLKWHRMKDGMPARYKQQLREVEQHCKIEVMNEFYKGE